MSDVKVKDLKTIINKMFEQGLIIIPAAHHLLVAIHIYESIPQVTEQEARYEMEELLRDLSLKDDFNLTEEDMRILKIILKELVENPFNIEGSLTGES